MKETIKTAPAPREEIHIGRGGEREDPVLFVGINGLNYLLPKGRTSAVPREVAEEIRRAQRAREDLAETMGSLQRTAP